VYSATLQERLSKTAGPYLHADAPHCTYEQHESAATATTTESNHRNSNKLPPAARTRPTSAKGRLTTHCDSPSSDVAAVDRYSATDAVDGGSGLYSAGVRSGGRAMHLKVRLFIQHGCVELYCVSSVTYSSICYAAQQYLSTQPLTRRCTGRMKVVERVADLECVMS
jgi:hypothetical protein